jgi:hypothetical protein
MHIQDTGRHWYYMVKCFLKILLRHLPVLSMYRLSSPNEEHHKTDGRTHGSGSLSLLLLCPQTLSSQFYSLSLYRSLPFLSFSIPMSISYAPPFPSPSETKVMSFVVTAWLRQDATYCQPSIIKKLAQLHWKDNCCIVLFNWLVQDGQERITTKIRKSSLGYYYSKYSSRD